MRLFVYGTCRKSRIHRAKAARAVDGRTTNITESPQVMLILQECTGGDFGACACYVRFIRFLGRSYQNVLLSSRSSTATSMYALVAPAQSCSSNTAMADFKPDSDCTIPDR